MHLISKILRCVILVVVLSDCAGRHKAVIASESGPQKILTMCLIRHPINESECKFELNFDNVSGRKCFFDATC